MPSDEWAPHAEKAFGHLTYAIGKRSPRKLTELRQTGRATLALVAPKHRKLKR